MNNIAGQKKSFSFLTNLCVFAIALLWLLPTFGLLVSSFRDRQQIAVSGWWEALVSTELTFRARASTDFSFENGGFVIRGNLFEDGDVAKQLDGRTGTISGFGIQAIHPDAYKAGEKVDLGNGKSLQVETDGSYKLVSREEPGSRGQRIYFSAMLPPSFTLGNYLTVLKADNMGQAFMNTLTVAIPSTIIPILIAAFAAYALSWMEFKQRGFLIAAIVGLLVVPLQLAFIPMLNLHNKVGIGQSFLGIWLAHSAFGMPLAVYLLRNYMSGLPRDIIENAKVDGANDFLIFTKIILPLSLPALASFSIFQFLWTWNDLLVAKVFLPSDDGSKVMTVKIADDLLGSRGGDWGILASAAFISIAVPLFVFFAMQRFLVRGLLAGSVK